MRGRTKTQKNWNRVYNNRKSNRNYKNLIIVMTIIVVICIVLFLLKYYERGYYISSMDVQVDVNNKKQYMVTETINVNFYAHKHGINRVLGDSISNYSYGISDINVKGAPFQIEKGNNLSIRIGDADEEVIGDKKYVITYTINHYDSGADNNRIFNMDVLGNHWDTKVKNFTARINFPNGTNLGDIHAYYDKLSGGVNYIYRKNSSSIRCERKDGLILVKNKGSVSANKGIKVKADFGKEAFKDIPEQPKDISELYYNDGSREKDYSFISIVGNLIYEKIGSYFGGLIFIVLIIISFLRNDNGNGYYGNNYYNDNYYDGGSSGDFGGGDSSGGDGGSSGDSGGGSSW